MTNLRLRLPVAQLDDNLTSKTVTIRAMDSKITGMRAKLTQLTGPPMINEVSILPSLPNINKRKKPGRGPPI